MHLAHLSLVGRVLKAACRILVRGLVQPLPPFALHVLRMTTPALYTSMQHIMQQASGQLATDDHVQPHDGGSAGNICQHADTQAALVRVH